MSEEWAICNDPDGHPALFFADPLLETIHFGRKVAEALSQVKNCLSERADFLESEITTTLAFETLDTHLDECGIFGNHSPTVVREIDPCSGEESKS